MITARAEIGAISHWGALILQRARDQALAAATNPDACHAAIVLSATGIEAFVNELQDTLHRVSQHADIPVVATLDRVLTELEEQRCPVESKLSIMYSLLTQQPANKGAAPFQDLAQLIALRNAVTHPRVISGPSLDALAKHKLIEPLLQRGVVLRSDLGGHRTWDRVVFGAAAARVAAWSYNTAVGVVIWAIEQITIPEVKSPLSRWQQQCPPLP